MHWTIVVDVSIPCPICWEYPHVSFPCTGRDTHTPFFTSTLMVLQMARCAGHHRAVGTVTHARANAATRVGPVCSSVLPGWGHTVSTLWAHCTYWHLPCNGLSESSKKKNELINSPENLYQTLIVYLIKRNLYILKSLCPTFFKKITNSTT